MLVFENFLAVEFPVDANDSAVSGSCENTKEHILKPNNLRSVTEGVHAIASHLPHKACSGNMYTRTNTV